MTDYRICLCECHTVIPVSIYDRVSAASACSKCHDRHVQRYVKGHPRPLPPPPDTSTVWVDIDPPEGRE